MFRFYEYSKKLFFVIIFYKHPGTWHHVIFVNTKKKMANTKKYINTKHIKYLYTAMSKTSYIRIMQSFN